MRLGDDGGEVGFHLDGVGVGGESEASGEAADMGVDDDAFIEVESVAEDDIGGFAADACELDEGVHGGGHLAAVFGDECGAAVADVTGLGAEEAGGCDEGFKLGGRDFRVVACGAAALEELLGDDVDALVRALGGQDGGDEEFEGVGEIELAVRGRISLREDGEDRGRVRGLASAPSTFCRPGA